MTLSYRQSRFVLTTHITFSVGWLGAVAVFIVLAVTGLTTANNLLSRSALLAMDLTARYVIVPFCLASLLTGLVQAFGTQWGLFKHYWIVVKLFLTVAMTVLLLLHMQPINYLAGVAAAPSFAISQYSGQLINIITKSGAAVLGLIAVTTISIYKPWGKIQPAQTGNNQFMEGDIKKSRRSPAFYLRIGLVVLLVIIIIKHLLGGGMNGH